MGAEDFAWADRLRRAHYPAERNLVPAHISLFHHLPPSILPELASRIRALCADPPPSAKLAEVLFLGRGVAIKVDSPDLMDMREELAAAFSGLLVPQDQGRPSLHITVQNKVGMEEARSLAERLKQDFRPRPLKIAGLAAWHYRGGPWELAMKTRFRG